MRTYSVVPRAVSFRTALPEQASAIELLWQAGLDTEEIGERLRLPECVVYNTLARLRG